MLHFHCDDACTISAAGASRLRGDPPRCIRHGNVLDACHGGRNCPDEAEEGA